MLEIVTQAMPFSESSYTLKRRLLIGVPSDHFSRALLDNRFGARPEAADLEYELPLSADSSHPRPLFAIAPRGPGSASPQPFPHVIVAPQSRGSSAP